MKQTNDPITTRFPSPLKPNNLPHEDKIHGIAGHFKAIMELLGLDTSNESLAKTPMRVAKMYVDEVFSGLNPETFPEITTMEEEPLHAHPQSQIVVSKCSFVSICEHHFVPIIGTAYVAYLPKKKLLGLSKLHRIVRFFAARPQLQERLTAQIADSIAIVAHTPDVAVTIDATHCCVLMRGVHDQHGATLTTHLLGLFQTDVTRHTEFLHAVERLTR